VAARDGEVLCAACGYPLDRLYMMGSGAPYPDLRDSDDAGYFFSLTPTADRPEEPGNADEITRLRAENFRLRAQLFAIHTLSAKDR